MLTPQSIPTRTRPIKSLNEPLQEAKTPEIERVFRADTKVNHVKERKDNDERQEIESEKSLLSTRAWRIKEYLNKTKEIDAVLLKADGSSQQIKCIPSSKQINKILNGRPTIIGELEEINAIIIRSLKKNIKLKYNQNILPPPYCNHRFYGNYLLFCVDSVGNPVSLSLKQYQIFVDEKQNLIQKMIKNTNNYNVLENRPIKVKHIFDSDSKFITLDACLKSEFDKKIRMECESKNNIETTDIEIENYVNKSIQDFVDNLVFEMSSNRMIDPDYDPEEDENEDPNYDPQEEEEDKDKDEEEEEEEEDWRLQLNEALDCVRERGQFDGGILAEKISQTFFDLNGVEPTLDELIEIFTKIKSKFIKNESELGVEKRIIERERERERDSDILSLKMFATPIIKSRRGISETYDVYFCKFSKSRKENNLLSAIKSFKMRNNRQPTKFEINRLKNFLSTNNKTTLVRFKLTVIDDDDDEEEDDDEKKSEIPKQKSKTISTRLLVTPVKKKKNSAKFNVYFKDKFDANKTENQAIKWFERFNNRKPNKIELNLIKQFIKSDNEELKEYEYDIPISDDDSNNYIMKKINYETDINSVVEKRSSTKYTLNFNDQTERKNGNKKQAIKWFTRFNNRNPTEDEKQNINQFIQNDDQDTIDID